MLKFYAFLIAGLMLNAVLSQAQDSARMRAYTEARYHTLKKSGTCLVAGGATAMVAGTFAMANTAHKTASSGTLHTNASFEKQALPGALLFAGGGVALVLGIARLSEANLIRSQLLSFDANAAPVQIGKTTSPQTGITLRWRIGD